MVLLPGMDGTGRLFDSFVNELPDGVEVEVLQYPSDRCAPYSELVSLVQARCSNSEPFVLLAESFSTPIAIRYAATNPSNLKGVILCAGFAESPLRGAKRFLASLGAPIVGRVALPKFAAVHWLIGRGAKPSLFEAVSAALSSVHPKVLSARIREVLACDVRLELARISAPMLYIQAGQDHLVKSFCLESIRRVKSQVEVVTLDGPHLLLQQEPGRSAEAVVRFVRAVGR